jgi:hypothetical protein
MTPCVSISFPRASRDGEGLHDATTLATTE